MKPKDLVLAEAMINERKEFILTKWNEIHGSTQSKKGGENENN